MPWYSSLKATRAWQWMSSATALGCGGDNNGDSAPSRSGSLKESKKKRPREGRPRPVQAGGSSRETATTTQCCYSQVPQSGSTSSRYVVVTASQAQAKTAVVKPVQLVATENFTRSWDEEENLISTSAVPQTSGGQSVQLESYVGGGGRCQGASSSGGNRTQVYSQQQQQQQQLPYLNQYQRRASLQVPILESPQDEEGEEIDEEQQQRLLQLLQLQQLQQQQQQRLIRSPTIEEEETGILNGSAKTNFVNLLSSGEDEEDPNVFSVGKINRGWQSSKRKKNGAGTNNNNSATSLSKKTNKARPNRNDGGDAKDSSERAC